MSRKDFILVADDDHDDKFTLHTVLKIKITKRHLNL